MESFTLQTIVLVLPFLSLRTLATDFNYPAVFNFGDSNSDTGGLAAGMAFPVGAPYGQTYFLKPAGRFCDGRLIIDFLSEYGYGWNSGKKLYVVFENTWEDIEGSRLTRVEYEQINIPLERIWLDFHFLRIFQKHKISIYIIHFPSNFLSLEYIPHPKQHIIIKKKVTTGTNFSNSLQSLRLKNIMS